MLVLVAAVAVARATAVPEVVAVVMAVARYFQAGWQSNLETFFYLEPFVNNETSRAPPRVALVC